jgi:transposase-like protein
MRSTAYRVTTAATPRNGYGRKTVKTTLGEAEIAVPRDRNGDFEPQVIAKRQTRTDDIVGRVLAMYAKGMSTRDIEDYLRDIYGVEASASLISRLKNRGVRDILIACRDNLSGFSGAVKAVFPRTEQQLCVARGVRREVGQEVPANHKVAEHELGGVIRNLQVPARGTAAHLHHQRRGGFPP